MSVYELETGKGTLEILISLYVNGPTSEGRLAKTVRPGQEAVGRSLSILSTLCLVELKKQTSFPFAKMYRLSRRGRILVETPLIEWPKLLIQDRFEGFSLRDREPERREMSRPVDSPNPANRALQRAWL